jgi:hypothetical protein
MSQNIQRLRYFDGEFLRSNDFTDEQNYHVAMRRRLNQALHLTGIVDGLLLSQDADSVPPSLLFFSVGAGFAIDQAGREIVVSAPYTLSADNVLGRAGLQAGANEVWIVYTETASGLPSPGYRLCDQAGQMTRWTEAFEVMLKPKSVPPKAGQDPDADLQGIRLGTVTLLNDAVNGWTIAAADALGRKYVGIRALSVVSPDTVDADTFSMAAQNVLPVTAGAPLAPAGYLDVAPGVFARGNLFVEQNVVIGDDFALDNTVYKALPAKMPANGSVKVNGDLFLNGGFYGFLDGGWLGLSDYILSLMPDVQISSVPLGISANAQNGTLPVITVKTKLAKFSKVDVQASLSMLQFANVANLEPALTAVPAIQWAVEVNASAANFQAGSADITLSWSLGEGYPTSSTTSLFLVTQAIATLIVVFRP